MLHFGLGSDSIIDRLTVTWPSGVVQVLEHLAADQHYTLTEPAEKPPRPARPKLTVPAGQFAEVSRSLNLRLDSPERWSDEWAKQPLLPWRLNRIGPGVAFADLNGDGEDEFCLGGVAGERARLASNFGGGHFMPPLSTLFGEPTGAADAMVLFFDANGDGKPDLLLTKGGVAAQAGSAAYRPRLFLNNGRGDLEPAPADTLPPFSESTGVAIAADYNRDGQLDLFLGGRSVPGAYPRPARSALLENRGGKFIDVTESLAPGLAQIGLVTSALWTDVDGDGWLDLVLTLEWGHVTYFHNRAGQGFDDWTERAGFSAAGTGWWNSIASGDLNGDGRPDYVVGNVGLNTKYRASPSHPALLFDGIFEDGKPPQLIEAQYEGEKLYPVRGLPQISAVLPSIGRRFPTFERYAGATLDDIFTTERLSAAHRYAATELRSGVLLSQPDGTYRFEPLPRLAQIAPIYGLVVGDFDGDGFADVYAIQNSSAPIAETGPFDGGLSVLLKGNGRGQLLPVPPASNGLLVPHAGKAVAVVDLDQDGWPDFFVTRNNDSTLVFHNRPVAGHHSFGVALQGSTGNPTGIGARITVKLTDGTTETAEVFAGGGYLSQSTATQFFGYTDANPPREIVVRWPDGRTSNEAWTKPSSKRVLSLPRP
jgi:hypothetical protein